MLLHVVGCIPKLILALLTIESDSDVLILNIPCTISKTIVYIPRRTPDSNQSLGQRWVMVISSTLVQHSHRSAVVLQLLSTNSRF